MLTKPELGVGGEHRGVGGREGGEGGERRLGFIY